MKDVRYLQTQGYTEFEVPLDSGWFGITYLVPRDNCSYYVCTCMPDDIASVINAYTKMDLRSQQATSQIYRQTWPHFMQLRSSGLAKRYSPAALTILEDPDDAVPKWFIATIVGNISSHHDLLGNKTILEAIARILKTSETMINEVSTARIDSNQLAAIRLRSDLGQDLTSVRKFVSKNFGPLVDLFEFWAKNDQS